jgi:hypothetical protein
MYKQYGILTLCVYIFLGLPVYIYIYMCVCVCVSETEREDGLQERKKSKKETVFHIIYVISVFLLFRNQSLL